MVLLKNSWRFGKFTLIAILMLSLISGCGVSQPDSVQQKNISGVEMFPLENISKISSIKATIDGEQIILQEDQLKITLSLGSRFIYRHEFITDNLSAAPVKVNGSVFLPVSFIDEYLTSNKDEDLSLYHGAKYLPSEVASALKDQNNEHNRKILSAIELPRSMDISIPKIDENRILQTQLLSDMPPELIEDLESQGYEDAGKYTYGEYQVISELQTLEEAGLTFIKQTYPELSQVDISDWTVRDYNQWQQEYVKELQSSIYNDEEKLLMQEKEILIEDMHYLRKEFYDAVFEQPDQVLKECLENYYRITNERILKQ